MSSQDNHTCYCNCNLRWLPGAAFFARTTALTLGSALLSPKKRGPGSWDVLAESESIGGDRDVRDDFLSTTFPVLLPPCGDCVKCGLESPRQMVTSCCRACHEIRHAQPRSNAGYSRSERRGNAACETPGTRAIPGIRMGQRAESTTECNCQRGTRVPFVSACDAQ